MKIAVQRCQHAVDGGWQIAALEKMVFPAADADFVDGFAVEPGGKGAKMAQVVGDGAGAALFALQIIDIVLKIVCMVFCVCIMVPPMTMFTFALIIVA